MSTDPKLTADTFFKLPVFESMEPQMTPLFSKDQPTAYKDANGIHWALVYDRNHWARQRIS